MCLIILFIARGYLVLERPDFVLSTTTRFYPIVLGMGEAKLSSHLPASRTSDSLVILYLVL